MSGGTDRRTPKAVRRTGAQKVRCGILLVLQKKTQLETQTFYARGCYSGLSGGISGGPRGCRPCGSSRGVPYVVRLTRIRPG